jgi:hypothetical protein
MIGCAHDPIGGPCDLCDPPPPREPGYHELEAEVVALRSALLNLADAAETCVGSDPELPGFEDDEREFDRALEAARWLIAKEAAR